MIKTWAGAFLAACLFAACPVSADNQRNDFFHPPEEPGFFADDLKEVVPGQGVLSVLIRALFSPGAKGFLTKENIPENMVFLPAGKGWPVQWGEMVFRKKDMLVPAIIVHSEFTEEEGLYLLHDMFGEMPLPERSRQELYRFNLMLLSSENIWNDMILSTLRKTNEWQKNKGAHTPYNLAAVDYLETEQLHRLRESPRIYTAGVRAVAAVDGIAVPLYVKMYIFPYGKSYRVLFLAGPESGHTVIKAGGDRLALRYAR